MRVVVLVIAWCWYAPWGTAIIFRLWLADLKATLRHQWALKLIGDSTYIVNARFVDGTLIVSGASKAFVISSTFESNTGGTAIRITP